MLVKPVLATAVPWYTNVTVAGSTVKWCTKKYSCTRSMQQSLLIAKTCRLVCIGGVHLHTFCQGLAFHRTTGREQNSNTFGKPAAKCLHDDAASSAGANSHPNAEYETSWLRLYNLITSSACKCHLSRHCAVESILQFAQHCLSFPKQTCKTEGPPPTASKAAQGPVECWQCMHMKLCSTTTVQP